MLKTMAEVLLVLINLLLLKHYCFSITHNTVNPEVFKYKEKQANWSVTLIVSHRGTKDNRLVLYPFVLGRTIITFNTMIARE